MDIKRPHVLVVEDDALHARLLQDALAPLEADITFVTSAEDALLSAEQRVPDVVIADNILPGRTGIELLLELGVQKGATRRVLITGGQRVAGPWGADIPVLWKPFAPATVRWLVSRLLAGDCARG